MSSLTQKFVSAAFECGLKIPPEGCNNALAHVQVDPSACEWMQEVAVDGRLWPGDLGKPSSRFDSKDMLLAILHILFFFLISTWLTNYFYLILLAHQLFHYQPILFLSTANKLFQSTNPIHRSVLAYLRPPLGPNQCFFLRPRLGLITCHARIRGTAQILTVVRMVPQKCILADPSLHATVLKGWKSYQHLASAVELPLEVVPVGDLWMLGCVSPPITRKALRPNWANRANKYSDPLLHVVPFS